MVRKNKAMHKVKFIYVKGMATRQISILKDIYKSKASREFYFRRYK